MPAEGLGFPVTATLGPVWELGDVTVGDEVGSCWRLLPRSKPKVLSKLPLPLAPLPSESLALVRGDGVPIGNRPVTHDSKCEQRTEAPRSLNHTRVGGVSMLMVIVTT